MACRPARSPPPQTGAPAPPAAAEPPAPEHAHTAPPRPRRRVARPRPLPPPAPPSTTPPPNHPARTMPLQTNDSDDRRSLADPADMPSRTYTPDGPGQTPDEAHRPLSSRNVQKCAEAGTSNNPISYIGMRGRSGPLPSTLPLRWGSNSTLLSSSDGPLDLDLPPLTWADDAP